MTLPNVLEIRQGDTWRESFTLTELAADGVTETPINLTGAVILAQHRTRPTAVVALNFTVTVTDAVAGKFQLSLSPAQTANLRGGVYDVQVTLASGDVVTYVPTGIVRVVRDVSRA